MVKKTFYKRLILIRKFKKEGRLLDVGCAFGFFLKLAEKYGFQPFGIDISSYAVKKARKIVKGKILQGDIEEDIPFPDNFFDVITLFDILEHLKNPKRVLSQLKKKIKHSGYIYNNVKSCFPCSFYLWKKMGRLSSISFISLHYTKKTKSVVKSEWI